MDDETRARIAAMRAIMPIILADIAKTDSDPIGKLRAFCEDIVGFLDKHLIKDDDLLRHHTIQEIETIFSGAEWLVGPFDE